MGKRGGQKKQMQEAQAAGASSPASPKRDGESVDPPQREVHDDPIPDEPPRSPLLGMSVKEDPDRAEGDDGGDTRDCSAPRLTERALLTSADDSTPADDDTSGAQVVDLADGTSRTRDDEDQDPRAAPVDGNDTETDLLSPSIGAPDPPLLLSHTANTLHVLTAELGGCETEDQDPPDAEAAHNLHTPVVDAAPLTEGGAAAETPEIGDATTCEIQHQREAEVSAPDASALGEEQQQVLQSDGTIIPHLDTVTDSHDGELAAVSPPSNGNDPVEEVSLRANATTTATVSNVAELAALDSLRNYVDSRMDRVHVNLIDLEASIRDTSQALQQVTETHPSQWTAAIALSEERQREAATRIQRECTEFAQARASEVYDSLAGALRHVQESHRQCAEQGVERCRAELMFLLNELAAGAVAEKEVARAHSEQVKREFAALTSQIRQLSQELTTALKMELLPPAAPLPTEGVKMRLVVTVDVPNRTSASNAVLLPITSLATVGMLKREVLRRSLQQQIIPAAYRECFVFSATVVVLDDVVLFEEDTLEDVGVQANDKLVIRLANPSSIADACTPVSITSSSSSSAVPPSATHVPAGPTTIGVAAPAAPASSVGTGVNVSAAPTALLSGSAAGTTNASPLPPSEVLVAVFLNENDATRLDEQESMDRRLTAELARMELDGVRREEEQRRTAILKAHAEKLRTTLLDRATYSHDEFERRAARGAMEKLNSSMERGATPSLLLQSIASAKQAIASLTATVGEEDRVAMLNAAMASERNRKARMIEDLKDFIFTVRHRVRIPAELYVRAEEIVFAADRAILLEPTITVKEVDEVHRNFSEFVASLKK